jgi:carbon monoxide dehydrogenase subunit G
VAELAVSIEVDAPQEQVWSALTDWTAHDAWMLGTRASGGSGVGETVEAFTGIGKVGFLDTMVIRVWDPPERCVVRHTGRVVRGSGAFEVEALGPTRSRVVWSEWLDLPLGAVGRWGWLVVRPVARLGLLASLKRLKAHVERGA